MSTPEFLDNYRIAKDKSDKRHVPVVAMRIFYKKLEEPSKSECDSLVEIKKINSKGMLSFWA